MNRYYISLVFALIFSLAGVQVNAQSQLISHYNFEDNDTDALGSNDLTEHTGAIFTAEDKAVGTYALQLDGDSSYAKIEEFTGFPAAGQAWSIAAWIKPTETQTSQWKSIMHVGDREAAKFIEFRAQNGIFRGLYYDTVVKDQVISGTLEYIPNQWYHLVLTFDGQELNFYVDGISQGTQPANPTYGTALRFDVGCCYEQRSPKLYWAGLVDDIRIYSGVLSEQEIRLVMSRVAADTPVPHDRASDLLRDTILSWTPGEFAGTHNVYFGTSFDDVNTATTPLAVLDVNTFDPGRLEFGATYYWRVDEVNGTPEKTVFKGGVWSFDTEPYSIAISPTDIDVTASSQKDEFSTPQKVIDGSGLDPNDPDVHGFEPGSMWLTALEDLDPWIQFEFDNVKKLDTMTVWNSNSAAESAVGWGVKDIEIACSVDGENWDVLPDANQFSRASGLPTYDTPDKIVFGGTVAKFVRLNIKSNWGGIFKAYGLSEVQFSAIPVRVRAPEPASDTEAVPLNATVSWRAGREAGEHTLYISTDPNAVAEGTARSFTVSTNSLDPGSLDLQMGQTYYWRVDEVNNAEAVSVWAGPLWSFSTIDSLLVEGFEGYGNKSPDRPFQTWLDGIGYSADQFFPVAYGGNGTGAAIGHDIWSLSSPHYDGTIMETTIVKSGSQSMPLYYSNAGGAASETQRIFDVAQDWTASGIKTLSLQVFGATGNTGQLYLKINNARLDGAPDISQTGWQAWNIDLSAVGATLQNVTSLTIGVEGAGAEGMLYIDEIQLYPLPADSFEPTKKGLIHNWTFDSDLTDAVRGKDATAFGDAGVQTPSKIGDGAAAFDGSGDYMTAGTAGDFAIGMGQMSVSFWLNVSDADKENSDRILSCGAGSNTQTGWTFFMRTNAAGTIGDGVDAGMSDGGGRRIQGTNANDTIDALDGNWHLLVGVFDYDGGNGKVDIYLDSVLETTIALADLGTWNGSFIGNTDALTFGAISGNPNLFSLNGLLDDVAIWDVPLSQGQIDALWNGGTGQAAALIEGE